MSRQRTRGRTWCASPALTSPGAKQRIRLSALRLSDFGLSYFRLSDVGWSAADRARHAPVARFLAGEEVQAEPGPGDEDADPAGSRAHDPGHYLAERRDLGPSGSARQVGADQPGEDDEEANYRDVMAVHRSTR